ncbi:MAG: hypothetical protein PVG78_14420 [Desulfobacterales bacterium]
MATEMDIVEALRKVSISMATAASPDPNQSDVSPKKAEFIFGIGTEGLSPLEAKLAGKRAGDIVVLSLETAQIPSIAGHLCQQLPPFPQREGPVYLHIRIDEVKPAENREIIQAMAAANACGAGCCGGH